MPIPTSTLLTLWDASITHVPPSHSLQPQCSRNSKAIPVTAQQESRGSIMKISDVKFRVQDLWKPFWMRKFIFQLGTLKESHGYRQSWKPCITPGAWELRSHVQRLQDQLINQIQNGKNPDTWNIYPGGSNYRIYEPIKQKLEKHYNEDTDSEVLVQWREILKINS